MEQSERVGVARVVHVVERDVQIVLRTQIDFQIAQSHADMAVAEPQSDHVVVAVEIAHEGVDLRHRPVEVDVVEDEHHVGVVARNRAVGGRDAERHLAFVGEFVAVDAAVDALGRGQETVFLDEGRIFAHDDRGVGAGVGRGRQCRRREEHQK